MTSAEDVPEVTFILDPAKITFNKGDNLELKCSGQGNPDPTLTLTTKETTDNLTNVQTTELTRTLTLDCMDTGVYVCSGQNNQGTNRTDISIGVRCPQQLSPLIKSQPQVDAVIRGAAKFGIEIYGFPEPSTLTLQRTDDATNLTSSSRHSVEYTAGVAPFGVVNVTISDVVEADFTIYTLTVDNGVGNALIYPFYLNEVNASSARVESIASKEDSLNIVAIVIGVIAVLIIAVFTVVIIFLLKKIRGLKGERMDPQDKFALAMSTIATPVSASLPPRQGQYETVDDKPAGIPRTGQYETIQDMTATSGTYNSTSRQDVEPLSVYQDVEPNHLTSGDLESCGPYSNVPGTHVENLRNPAENYANVDVPSAKGNNQNKRFTKQAYQNVEMK
ncbi:hypothetical protein RRG08_059557 [Elysia crispata]|uniref:Ig-like domain-containing protein n=1 Tax=Elysia crispata TaxID=231223 RepID=A0AAE1AKB4_9GAST|nr:hypothetical protein RRG08_059557 [Elysia crispata]